MTSVNIKWSLILLAKIFKPPATTIATSNIVMLRAILAATLVVAATAKVDVHFYGEAG